MGIKSFQGQQVGEVNKQAEKITVRDCMSQNMILFNKAQSIIEVVEILIKFRVSGGPVVDDQKRVIGIISEGDCVKQISESRYYNMPMEDVSVEKYMSKEVNTISPDVSLFDAANLFLKSKRRRFPVVENDRIIGIVSQKDILRAALMLKGFSWKHKK
ncbi:CBS_pair domain superfamily protein [Psychroflexus torquis ATCC 700755]|uniref:CBS_pair domain superfamily protein n=1 Tax=Psychroflexus torquis (strain ATCC 700755 / CIP 106069 / ACAM 623) TaxID=313595 RepID=K4IEG8_PSYTT|nr:CBS domain-containing protein [Psychroflexus torquis]AFU68248.1 CBS_pair domain superfamily protein [Psychroflexus torquis ATCC 700755]